MNSGPAVPDERSHLWHYLLPLVLLLTLTRLWVMPMVSSFWVDEMGTVFVVRHGPGDPSLAIAPQVPQSVYYLLPRGVDALVGVSEFGYRLPSLAAMAAALWLIARLAARMIAPGAGWFAVFACLALRGFDYQAADARPYGLGTLAACGCLWFLVRWLDSGGLRDGAGFVVLAALLWRVQLIFWPFYLVFGIYAATRLVRRSTPVTWKAVAIAFGTLGVALTPVLVKAIALYRQAGAHVIVALPSPWDLILSLKIGLIAACGAGAWLVSKWSRSRLRGNLPQKSSPGRGREEAILILTWWLGQPLGLFVFSWLTGNSVFVARYLGLSLPGAALAATWAATWAARQFVSPRQWSLLAAALGVGVLLMNGQWNRPAPWHHNSDWRGAARKIQDLGLAADTPVICPSPFIEAKPPEWRPDYPLPGFLYAHLPVYPVPGKTWLFPFEDSPEAEEFARRLATGTLARSSHFVLYGGQGQVDFWTDWFAARPELAGRSVERFRQFGDVEVVVSHQ
jgi:hypothetical protein